MKRMTQFAAAVAAAVVLGAPAARAEVVGQVGVDWIGNDIMVDAVVRSEGEGCDLPRHLFRPLRCGPAEERQLVRRSVQQLHSMPPDRPDRNCDIDLGKGGEEVFKSGLSLIWKKLVVNRIYDKQNDTLIYLIHSRQIVDGSAKMSISTVPLFGQNVTWQKGKPAANKHAKARSCMKPCRSGLSVQPVSFDRRVFRQPSTVRRQ